MEGRHSRQKKMGEKSIIIESLVAVVFVRSSGVRHGPTKKSREEDFQNVWPMGADPRRD